MCASFAVLLRSGLLGLAVGLGLLVSQVAAQETPEEAPAGAPTETANPGMPPEPGLAIVEDPLTGPGVVTASTCPTQRNARAFVGEGYLLKVSGKCTDANTTAGVSRRIDGVMVPDGEVRLEVKPAAGPDRLLFRLWFRQQVSGGQASGGYYLTYEPSRGSLSLRSWAGAQTTILAERTDLSGMIAAEDWNSLAVRLQGPNIWVLLNDQPVLSAMDPSYDGGEIHVGVVRLGDPNDEQESSAVVRNLRVSSLQDGDTARAPIYQGPAAAPPSTTRSAPPPSGPPWIGDITFGYDPSGAGAVPAGSSVRIRDGSRLHTFFSWRNMPAESKIDGQVLWNGQGRFNFVVRPSSPQGSSAEGVVRFAGGQEGGAYYTLTEVTVVLSMNGQELARGSVATTE